MQFILAVSITMVVAASVCAVNGPTLSACSCSNKMNLIIYHSVGNCESSSASNYYSWDKVCNRGRKMYGGLNNSLIDSDKLERKRFYNLMGDGSLSKYQTEEELKLIKSCLNKCNRSTEENAQQTKFWMGLRYHCNKGKWLWEKDNTLHFQDRNRSEYCNRTEPEDECMLMQNTHGRWDIKVATCSSNYAGYVCQYQPDASANKSRLFGKTVKLDSCLKTQHNTHPTMTEVPTTTHSVQVQHNLSTQKPCRGKCNKEVKKKFRKLIKDALIMNQFTIKSSLILLSIIQEYAEEILQRGNPIPTESLRLIAEALYKMIPTELDVSSNQEMVMNFTRTYASVAGQMFESLNAHNWVEVSRKKNKGKSHHIHPMHVVDNINTVSSVTKNYLHDVEIKTGSITINVKKLRSNSGSSCCNGALGNSTQRNTLVETPLTDLYEDNLTAVSITFTSIVSLLNNMMQEMENIMYMNSANQTRLGPNYDSNELKPFIAGSSLLSYTLYENEMKKSIPINFTIHTSNDTFQDDLKPSCEFYNGTTMKWSDYGCQVLDVRNSTIRCSCNHTTNFAVVLVHVDIQKLKNHDSCGQWSAVILLNYICNSLSCLFLILTIFSYVALKEMMRNINHERLISHLNLSIAMLGMFLSFLLGEVAAATGYAECITNAVASHFFILASFAWMTVEGLLLNLYIVQGNIRNTTLGWKKFAIGWGSPTLICIVTLAAAVTRGDYIYRSQKYDTLKSEYNTSYHILSERECWLTYNNGLVWASTGPILVALAVNAFYMVRVLTVVVQLSMDTKRYRPSKYGSGSDHTANSTAENKTRPNIPTTVFKAFLKLYPILGLPWLIGWISSFFINAEEAICDAKSITFLVFSYTHSLLNGLQGVFIFIVCVVNDNHVWCALKRRLQNCQWVKFKKHSYGSGIALHS